MKQVFLLIMSTLLLSTKAIRLDDSSTIAQKPKVTQHELKQKIKVEKKEIKKTEAATVKLEKKIKKLTIDTTGHAPAQHKPKKPAKAPTPAHKRHIPRLMLYWIAGTVFLLLVITVIVCLCVRKKQEEPEKKEDDVSFERFKVKTETIPILNEEEQDGLPSVNIIESAYDEAVKVINAKPPTSGRKGHGSSQGSDQKSDGKSSKKPGKLAKTLTRLIEDKQEELEQAELDSLASVNKMPDGGMQQHQSKMEDQNNDLPPAINTMPKTRPSRSIYAIDSPKLSHSKSKGVRRGSRSNVFTQEPTSQMQRSITEVSPKKADHKIDLKRISRAADNVIDKIDQFQETFNLPTEGNEPTPRQQ